MTGALRVKSRNIGMEKVMILTDYAVAVVVVVDDDDDDDDGM